MYNGKTPAAARASSGCWRTNESLRLLCERPCLAAGVFWGGRQNRGFTCAGDWCEDTVKGAGFVVIDRRSFHVHALLLF